MGLVNHVRIAPTLLPALPRITAQQDWRRARSCAPIQLFPMAFPCPLCPRDSSCLLSLQYFYLKHSHWNPDRKLGTENRLIVFP